MIAVHPFINKEQSERKASTPIYQDRILQQVLAVIKAYSPATDTHTCRLQKSVRP